MILMTKRLTTDDLRHGGDGLLLVPQPHHQHQLPPPASHHLVDGDLVATIDVCLLLLSDAALGVCVVIVRGQLGGVLLARADLAVGAALAGRQLVVAGDLGGGECAWKD